MDSTELFHEWMATVLQFMAGKRVRTPAMVRPPAAEVQRTRKRKIIDSLREALTGG